MNYLGENKGADQLRGNCEADQHLCFGYTVQSLFFLNPKFKAFSLFLRLYRPICVRPGQKPILKLKPINVLTGAYITNPSITWICASLSKTGTQILPGMLTLTPVGKSVFSGTMLEKFSNFGSSVGISKFLGTSTGGRAEKKN